MLVFYSLEAEISNFGCPAQKSTKLYHPKISAGLHNYVWSSKKWMAEMCGSNFVILGGYPFCGTFTLWNILFVTYCNFCIYFNVCINLISILFRISVWWSVTSQWSTGTIQSCGSMSLSITPAPCCKPGYRDKDIKITITMTRLEVITTSSYILQSFELSK